MSDEVIEDGFFDKRYKVLPCQVERIRRIREQDKLSYGVIASVFFYGTKLSRQTVYLICNPDKREQARATTRNLHSKGRYADREKSNYKMGKTRANQLTIRDIFKTKK